MTIDSLSYVKATTTPVVKNHHHSSGHPLSPPPDLLRDNEEEEEEEEENDADSLSTPSLISSSSPIQQPTYFNRIHSRKSVPHKSPSINELFQIPMHNKSVVFQLDTTNNLTNDCKVISGQSLLSSLRKQMVYARLQNQHHPIIRKRISLPSLVEIPISSSRLAHNKNRRRRSTNSLGSTDRIVKHSGRPSRKKGPCQACQEASDGCMRKAFNWPFPTSQIFNDKGKPFVYLCNKCGLRYNKSGGAVCRHCRWVICKEEKRKALHHIDFMLHNRPADAIIDPEEDIEKFVCNPKYWKCGKPWKVGWVLTTTAEEDDDTLSSVTSN